MQTFVLFFVFLFKYLSNNKVTIVYYCYLISYEQKKLIYSKSSRTFSKPLAEWKRKNARKQKEKRNSLIAN